MKRPTVAPLLVALLAAGTGCLEPLVGDELEPGPVFGDPSVNPMEAPHVEDDPALAAKVAQFPGKVAYLNGYADGAPVRYWNAGGPVPGFIAPIYQLVDPEGRPLGRRIIDAIPGDPGYSPWWRLVTVATTPKYAGERIWSRAAINEGIRTGILAAPVAQRDVLDCPVVRRSTRVDVGGDEPASPTWGWYRGKRVHWIDFESSTLQLDPTVREMPAFPVYVMQRIDEPEPLYEFTIDRDLNGDADTNDSNNVFSSGVGGARYSPLWYPVNVRVVAEYVSIDTRTSSVATATVGLSAERQIVDDEGKVASPLVVPGRVAEARDLHINCPIQKTGGAL